MATRYKLIRLDTAETIQLTSYYAEWVTPGSVASLLAKYDVVKLLLNDEYIFRNKTHLERLPNIIPSHLLQFIEVPDA
jgi:hypothetical protein